MPGEPVARINRLIAQPEITPTKTPSDEQAHNDSRFDSNMDMTA